MIESIKNQLWDVLKEKKVSLVMIYTKNGNILWHEGRKIKGKSIAEGTGFSKTFIRKTLNADKEKSKAGAIKEKNVLVNISYGDLPKSAIDLHIKSLLIFPINENFFLYIDSGTKEFFSDIDFEVFNVLGKLLGENIRRISKSETGTGGITGSSEAISRIKDLVIKFSVEDDSVLLLGETGVGKTHIAELIHHYSGRKGKFVTADTTTINENLFESEVFGHKKGSFTGADADKKGLIDEAKEGTLFFDEIAEVPVSFQAKLLRLIENKKYRVVGETCEKKADVRIVAATNKDLPGAIERKEFRPDLYFRLNVLEIKIPPLRQRKKDIKTLIMEKRKYLKGKKIGEGFWEVMLNYGWPGNLRELFTVLKRAGILWDSPITGKKIREIIDENMSGEAAIKSNHEIERIRVELKAGISFWDVIKKPFLQRDLNRSEVKRIIAESLLECGGKYADTLPYFNIDRSEYKRFMKFLHKNKLQ
ncbi:MAG: sigma-54-dependent Fis family transcriptional regulator [Candidatus Aminicenantes bacterium]|nr:sigma-54-dependent Fis family transcriptional regulator [Candidatus Aminicenantes bacterium]